MLELDKITADTFAPHLHDSFQIVYDGSEVLMVELVELNIARQHPYHGTERSPFSLVFRGGQGRYLPQHQYQVRHDTLGELDIFLVSLGPNSDGFMQYEAVFG